MIPQTVCEQEYNHVIRPDQMFRPGGQRPRISNHRWTTSCLLALALGLLSVGRTPADVIVYDNTTVPSNILFSDLFEFGDQLTLAGTERAVTRFSFLATSLSHDPIDTTLRFYANDGPGGEPGSLLFSLFLPQVEYSNPGVPLTIPIPGVVVPDTFTFTLEFDFRGGEAGLELYHPPTVGSSGDFLWDRLFGSWDRFEIGFGSNLYARVEAVDQAAAIPEPGTLALCAIGMLSLVGYGWCRRVGRWK